MDEKLLQDAEIMVNKLGISRNKYINDAVSAYTKAQKRAEMEAQIKREVALIRESSMEVLAEFEALEDDYEY
jgi:metal-responsive CopG/Arc/MetJ family transcriptional regulator